MLQAPDQGSRTPGVRECGQGTGGEGKGEPLPWGILSVPHPFCPLFTQPRVFPTPGCWSRAVGCQPLPSAVQTAGKPFLAHFGMGRGFPSESHFLEGPLGHPQGWEMKSQLVPLIALSSLLWGFWGAGWDFHEVEE